MEASLVIPLFVYAVITVIYLLQVTAVKSRMSQALYSDARQLAKYAYLYDLQKKEQKSEQKSQQKSELLNNAAAYGILVKELGTEFAKDHNIVGGMAGIVLAGSQILENDNMVNLQVSYVIRNPLDVFGLHIMYIEQNCSTQAWLGEDGQQRSDFEENDKDRIVYAAIGGEVYHESRSCTYLDPVVIEAEPNEVYELRNASGGIYYPCERCGNSYTEKGVYITEYGNRYHNDRNCSSLKRTIVEIPFSKVGSRRPCSKCAGKKGET